MDDYTAWRLDADRKLEEASHIIHVVRKSLTDNDGPWDAADYGLRLAKKKLAIAAVNLAAARTRFAQATIDNAYAVNESFEADEAEEGTNDPL